MVLVECALKYVKFYYIILYKIRLIAETTLKVISPIICKLISVLYLDVVYVIKVTIAIHVSFSAQHCELQMLEKRVMVPF